jgi:hypothetical protein
VSGAAIGAFCSWVIPVAILLAVMSAVVLAIGIHAEDRIITLVAAPLFVAASFVGAGCFWWVLDG